MVVRDMIIQEGILGEEYLLMLKEKFYMYQLVMLVDFTKVLQAGNNKYSNSIVAIDLENKKLLWEFQEIQHDIWNFDIASPPILTSITNDNQKIDVVIAPTKFGNTLVLDRLSGDNIFEYKEVKVPLSNVPGEKTSFYQKIFSLPEPFSNQYFTDDQVTDISKKSSDFVKEKIKESNYGLFVPNSIDKKNIIYKGGAQWMGASVDNNNGIMYLTSNDIPAFVWLEKLKKKVITVMQF